MSYGPAVDASPAGRLRRHRSVPYDEVYDPLCDDSPEARTWEAALAKYNHIRSPPRSDRRALDYDNVFKCWYNGGGGTQWRQIRDFYKVASKTMDRDYQINPDKPSVVRAEEAYEEYFTWRGRR